MTSENSYRGRMNEILLGFHVNNNKWFSKTAKQQLKELRGVLEHTTFKIEDQKAQKMSEAFLHKARMMGYSTVKNVYWIGDNNSITINQLKHNIDPKGQLELDFSQKSNPTDLMVEFHRGIQGKFERWLGISAKSAIRSDGKIGFKNPGLSTMDRELGLSLSGELKLREEEFAEAFNLSKITTRREVEIRRTQRMMKLATKVGDELLEEFRDEIYKKLTRLNFDAAHKHLLDVWMNAGELFPPYLKITGSGEKPPFNVKVENPNENTKLDAINSGNIRFNKAGTHSINVVADGKKIFNIRLKFKGIKMASSIKLSADSL